MSSSDHPLVRRRALMLTTGAFLAGKAWIGRPLAAEKATRRFTLDLCPGRIGVNSDQEETIRLAAKFGFESVEPNGNYLAGLNESQFDRLAETLRDHKLVWGAGGLPVDFRKDDERFESDLKQLPGIAKGFQRAGVTRIGTWLMPAHDEWTYRANFDLHTRRLRAIARILGDHNLRLGLEYVGPRTSWSGKRYAFIHTMAETKELLASIGLSNVGFVLDSWHWYTAEETADDLHTLTAQDIVAVDLNDAPAGIAVEAQIDNRRELPAATGVIDVKTFLQALMDLGYDGPVRAEPFNQPLNAMDNEPAVESTAKAMKKAFDLVG